MHKKRKHKDKKHKDKKHKDKKHEEKKKKTKKKRTISTGVEVLKALDMVDFSDNNPGYLLSPESIKCVKPDLYGAIVNTSGAHGDGDNAVIAKVIIVASAASATHKAARDARDAACDTAKDALDAAKDALDAREAVWDALDARETAWDVWSAARSAHSAAWDAWSAARDAWNAVSVKVASDATTISDATVETAQKSTPEFDIDAAIEQAFKLTIDEGTEELFSRFELIKVIFEATI